MPPWHLNTKLSCKAPQNGVPSPANLVIRTTFLLLSQWSLIPCRLYPTLYILQTWRWCTWCVCAECDAGWTCYSQWSLIPCYTLLFVSYRHEDDVHDVCVLSVMLGGLVTHSEAWYHVIHYSLYLTDMKMMYMMCVVLGVMLVGLVTHSEAWYHVIPYSLYFTAMKMIYMVCVVLSVMLGGLVTHNEAWNQVTSYSLYLTDMKMMYMMCVVLSVMLGGLVPNNEAWYPVIPYSFYLTDMKMIYMVCVVLSVMLDVLLTVKPVVASQQTRGVGPMLSWRWASVVDGGPTC